MRQGARACLWQPRRASLDVHHFIAPAARTAVAGGRRRALVLLIRSHDPEEDRPQISHQSPNKGTKGAKENEATVTTCRATGVMGIAVAREFARYRLLRACSVHRGAAARGCEDRSMDCCEMCGLRTAVPLPAEGPMQADLFRHQAGIWQGRARER